MNSAIERLLGLRVADVMQRDVITVSESDPVAKAAQVLIDAEISGAPVVDVQGRCVGMLSAADFVRQLAIGHEYEFVVRRHPLAAIEVERKNEDLVASHMTPEVLGIAPEANLVQVARRLCAQHVHRLVVLDPDRRLLGIVSSLDVVAALVAAIEE